MTPDEFAQFNLREQCIAACVAEFHRQARDVDVPLRYAKSLEGTAAMFYDTVASLIRADEREFLAPEVPMARDDLRNELRARVAALPPWLSGSSPLALAVSRADVLALLDGGSE